MFFAYRIWFQVIDPMLLVCLKVIWSTFNTLALNTNASLNGEVIDRI